MHKPLLFTLLLIILPVVTAQSTIPRTIKWEKVYGWKNKGVKAYVDVKSIQLSREENSNRSVGMILFYRDKPVEFNLYDEKVTANIFASYYAVDCTEKKIGTVYEYYFNMQRLPTSMDQPLRAYDYSDEVKDVRDVSNEDPILNTLCVKYI